LAAGTVSAAWPDKPLKIVVPFPAGGASDATARAVGQTLARRLGQPVVIENRPGASGAIAAQSVLASPPDGYTILWASAGMVSLPYVQMKPPYQSMTELVPVATVARLPFCAFVHPSVPAKTLAEFKAEAKRQPGKLSFASGSLSEYLAAMKLDAATGAKMQYVPYKGGAQLMPDLVAGRVQVNIGPCSTGMPFVATGRLRVLATVLESRSALLPDVPTAREAGMPELAVPTWQALLVPPRTPKAIAERLGKETAEALKDRETLAQFAKIGVEASYRDAAGLEALVREEAPVWERFVRENGIERE
jgi:tripartite-type tricarboxylate transporter receptor subunit TctC